MQHQPSLIHESAAEALRDAVRACGGSKLVGSKLWPALAADQAGRKLNDCLNSDRREQLDVQELMMILRLARVVGYHGAADYLMAECGYARPVPVEPQDERAAIQREYVAAVASLTALAARMDRLDEAQGPRLAAAR